MNVLKLKFINTCLQYSSLSFCTAQFCSVCKEAIGFCWLKYVLDSYFCIASWGEGLDYNLAPTKKGPTVKLTSQNQASLVLASTIAIVLPQFSCGFF